MLATDLFPIRVYSSLRYIRKFATLINYGPNATWFTGREFLTYLAGKNGQIGSISTDYSILTSRRNSKSSPHKTSGIVGILLWCFIAYINDFKQSLTTFGMSLSRDTNMLSQRKNSSLIWLTTSVSATLAMNGVLRKYISFDSSQI